MASRSLMGMGRRGMKSFDMGQSKPSDEHKAASKGLGPPQPSEQERYKGVRISYGETAFQISNAQPVPPARFLGQAPNLPAHERAMVQDRAVFFQSRRKPVSQHRSFIKPRAFGLRQ